MLVVSIKNRTDLNEFREHARKLWARNIVPEDVKWQTETGDELFFEDANQNIAAVLSSDNRPLTVPQRFLTLAGNLICHSSKDTHALLYRLVYRLQKDKHLLDIKTDFDTAKAFAMERSVRRDCHRMQAFLRFRETGHINHEKVRVFTAWFEPEHFIIEKNSPFFCRRFCDMDWHILSPKGQAHFVQGKLSHSLLPAVKPNFSDNTEQLWQTYFSSSFNPARIKIKSMENHMPKKYWHNLPEAALIPGLIKAAHQRTRAMALAPPREAPTFHSRLRLMNSNKNRDDNSISSFDTFKNALQDCKACPLYNGATQAVCGQGNLNAELMFVGEQPGDHEDLSGRPFVGPAGQFLEKYLVRSGINRHGVYMTNAVKHFKYERIGKRRMHKTANINEIEHCRWWLMKEIQLIQPKLIVTLGLTAFFSITGTRAKMHEVRGTTSYYEGLPPILATFHPSYFLRQQNQKQSQTDLLAFEQDLNLAQRQIAERPQ